MSVPAREAQRWTPAAQPARRPGRLPTRVPAARPPISDPPLPHRRTRRGPHTAFWVFTLIVVSSMVVGLVAVNAMRVDAAYEARVLAEQVHLMTGERETLVNDVARLSSPSRIGTWARAKGLVHPAAGDVVILQVPGTVGVGPDHRAGAGE